jgi:hypothetical protein
MRIEIEFKIMYINSSKLSGLIENLGQTGNRLIIRFWDAPLPKKSWPL